MAQQFTGFPQETIGFLTGLRDNNSKSWFEAHRSDYDQFWMAVAKDFVVAAGEALLELEPNIEAQPKVNGSIFRINRDTRFSKDKTPYKDHLDFWFWQGQRKGAVSGYFMRVSPTSIGIGVGAHGFDSTHLKAFRSAVVSDDGSLESAVNSIEAADLKVHGSHYKRLPRDFEPVGEFQERLLLFNALYTAHEQPVERFVGKASIVDEAMTHWSTAAPLHRWLVDRLG